MNEFRLRNRNLINDESALLAVAQKTGSHSKWWWTPEQFVSVTLHSRKDDSKLDKA